MVEMSRDKSTPKTVNAFIATKVVIKTIKPTLSIFSSLSARSRAFICPYTLVSFTACNYMATFSNSRQTVIMSRIRVYVVGPSQWLVFSCCISCIQQIKTSLSSPCFGVKRDELNRLTTHKLLAYNISRN